MLRPLYITDLTLVALKMIKKTEGERERNRRERKTERDIDRETETENSFYRLYRKEGAEEMQTGEGKTREMATKAFTVLT